MQASAKKCPTCGLDRNPSRGLCIKCDKGQILTAVKNGHDPFDYIAAKRLVWMAIVAMGFMILIPNIVMVALIPELGLEPGQTTGIEKLIYSLYPGLVENATLAGQVIGILCFVLIGRRYMGAILATFKNYKGLLISVAATVVMILINMGWTQIVQSITGLEGNTNQESIQSGMQAAAFVSFLTTAICAPLVEEFTFRCGMFSLIRRKSLVAAVIISAVVFALMHFNFAGANMLNELLCLPGYLLPGFVLAILYHKYGFAASLTCHVLNNTVASIMILVSA